MSDKTDILYSPHYIEVGDIVELDYEQDSPEDKDYGDLLDSMSYKELYELSIDFINQNDRPAARRVLRAVQSAESELDSYLAMQYDVPVQLSSGQVPSIVLNLALRLFRYHMYSRRPAVPDDVKIDYDRVVGQMQSLAAGKSEIPEYTVTQNVITSAHQFESEMIIGTVSRTEEGSIFKSSRDGTNRTFIV